MLHSHSLCGIHLVVFAHSYIFQLISNVKTSEFATGILGQVGNKGGVAISFDIADKKILCVANHLPSGQDKVEKRSKAFWKIEKNLKIGEDLSKERASDRFDATIWLGDFNYRINGTNKLVQTY